MLCFGDGTNNAVALQKSGVKSVSVGSFSTDPAALASRLMSVVPNNDLRRKGRQLKVRHSLLPRRQKSTNPLPRLN
jgi:hypothetical protein